MGEKSYLVYEPTPLGGGIPIGLFSSIELATLFISAYLEKYYHQAHLSVLQVDVNNKNNLHSFMNDLYKSEALSDPYTDAFAGENGD